MEGFEEFLSSDKHPRWDYNDCTFIVRMSIEEYRYVLRANTYDLPRLNFVFPILTTFEYLPTVFQKL